jgi:excisionase family DNA binding protein
MLPSKPVSAAPAPRLLRINEAAEYVSSTTWFMETLIREGKIPHLILGKRRVIDVRDLDVWIEEQKKLVIERSVHVIA